MARGGGSHPNADMRWRHTCMVPEEYDEPIWSLLVLSNTHATFYRILYGTSFASQKLLGCHLFTIVLTYYRVSHNIVFTFIFLITRLPRGLEIPSWTFFNSPFPIIRIKRWRRAFIHQNVPNKVIGTSMRHSSWSLFGRSTGNDISGHYKGHSFLFFSVV